MRGGPAIVVFMGFQMALLATVRLMSTLMHASPLPCIPLGKGSGSSTVVVWDKQRL